MDTRKALDSQAIALMLVLCLIWGLQQVVLKATAADIAPILQIGLRSGVAALLVGLLTFARGERMRVSDGTWRPGVVVGLFMTPLFGIVFGAWLLSEPIETSFLIGAVPVLAGIVLVSGGGWVMQVLGGVGRWGAWVGRW